jgi:nitrite reductase/ring-hydroxylating ferredoxin subunit
LYAEVNEIEESRAKIFCVDKERIAIYKHENKLYALHNVCKHQGGPLGEGKILDGCITCPWHGYQYFAAEMGNRRRLSKKW